MTLSTHFVSSVRTKSRSGAIAAVLSILMMTGCGDDREERPAAPQVVPTDPEQTEQYREEMRDPQRDTSTDDDSSDAAATAQLAMIDLATAQISPTDGNETSGTVTFRPSKDQRAMLVSVNISGLTPGKHGFHIHENGDCSAPDASSAGGHFNPYKTTHGAPNAAERHLGDLGNVEANEEGRVDVEIQFEDLAFSGPASILQKALVIHAGADDLSTDPSGASGGRVGCGVIRADTAGADKGV